MEKLNFLLIDTIMLSKYQHMSGVRPAKVPKQKLVQKTPKMLKALEFMPRRTWLIRGIHRTKIIYDPNYKFTGINIDILDHITDWLYANEIGNLAATCKYMRNMLKDLFRTKPKPITSWLAKVVNFSFCIWPGDYHPVWKPWNWKLDLDTGEYFTN
jgi:hypothetical protein